MINLDIEVLVNGRAIKIDSKLNDLISNYLVEKLGALEETPILDNTYPGAAKKYKPARVYGESEQKLVRWTEDEEITFAVRVEELRKTGINFSKIGKQLSAEFGDRSPGALYQKIMEMKRKGEIKIV